jgi:hypothetical protein
VSDKRRSNPADFPRCSRCQMVMAEVVSLTPTVSEPGLIGYECPSCGHVSSVLLPCIPPKG